MTEIIKHETLVEALCAAMLEMEYVDKGQKNAQEGYSYRGIDDVMFGVRNPLMRHGVFVHFTYGRAVPVHPVDHPNHDPFFWRLPIKATIHHAHSDQTMDACFEGFGRTQIKGGDSRPDPRALGQASSYGIKMWLIGQFMVAGGDDSADQAPKADDAPAPARAKGKKADKAEEADKAAADPELEQTRQATLDLIGGLAPELQAQLSVTLKAERLSVKNATSVEELHEVRRIIGDLVAADVEAQAAEGDTEADTEEDNPASEIAEEQVSDPEPEDTEEDTPAAAEVSSDHPAAQEERHLAAVPDPGEEKPKRRAARAATAAEPVEPPEFSDQALAYLVVSEGAGTSPRQLSNNMKLVSAGLEIFKKIKSGELVRDGLTLLDPDGKVVHDGSQAAERYRAS